MRPFFETGKEDGRMMIAVVPNIARSVSLCFAPPEQPNILLNPARWTALLPQGCRVA
jgi:hypothetical protein